MRGETRARPASIDLLSSSPLLFISSRTPSQPTPGASLAWQHMATYYHSAAAVPLA